MQSARKLAASGEFPEAIAVYQEYVTAYPRSEAARMEMAECYRRVHNLELARATLQVARRRNPKSAKVLIGLGNLEIEDQSWDAAVEALRGALALEPSSLEARNLLGSALQGKNDLGGALREFNYVLARDSQNQLAHYLRAEVYADSGENEKGVSDAEVVVAARPGYLPGRVLLAKMLVRLKQCARAVELLQTAHEAKQLDAGGLFILGNAYDCAGQPERGKRVREEFAAAALADHERDENEVQSKHLVEQANEFARQNNFAEAVELLQEALNKNPQNAFAYSQKAKILFSQGNLGGARSAIEQALGLQPFQPDFLYVLGIIAEREGKMDAALAALSKVAAINPKEADAFFEIGKIRLQQGDRPAAVSAFKKAAALEPGDPDYQAALKKANGPER